MSEENQNSIHKDYLRYANKFDLLESEEEFILAENWKKSMDPKSANRLISAHLRLVQKIANGYKGYGLPVMDLISEGHIGMMKALNKFDPQKGFRFSTYAIWWIKAQMQQFILSSWSLVKIGTTSQQRKLFFNLRRMKAKKLAAGDSFDEAALQEIAQELNVSEADVADMDRRLSLPDHSLNVSFNGDGEDGDEWQEFLVDEKGDHEMQLSMRDETNKRSVILSEALKTLAPREHSILYKRRIQEPPSTLESLSQELGVSKERVRQIENRSFEKLHHFVQEHPLLKEKRI